MRSFFVLSLVAVVSAANAGVLNGNFSGGAVDFTSDYTYVTPGGSNLNPEGTYTVDTDANNSHGSFVHLGDHTTGDGNYMIVNGASDTSKTVWAGTTDFSVESGVTYSFSVWIANVYSASPAQLTFSIDGTDLNATPISPEGAGVWQQFSVDYTATSNGVLAVSLRNANGEPSGNDFAIDDVDFAKTEAVPEPATLAVLGLGVGALLRRRKRA